jgi:Flp pilus assembly protein TadD
MEPGSTPRIRQNLALALGLKGDDKSAERLLRAADLDEQSVGGDLRYYAALRQLNQNKAEANAPVASPRLPVSVDASVSAASTLGPASSTSTPAAAEGAAAASAPTSLAPAAPSPEAASTGPATVTASETH